MHTSRGGDSPVHIANIIIIIIITGIGDPDHGLVPLTCWYCPWQNTAKLSCVNRPHPYRSDAHGSSCSWRSGVEADAGAVLDFDADDDEGNDDDPAAASALPLRASDDARGGNGTAAGPQAQLRKPAAVRLIVRSLFSPSGCSSAPITLSFASITAEGVGYAVKKAATVSRITWPPLVREDSTHAAMSRHGSLPCSCSHACRTG